MHENARFRHSSESKVLPRKAPDRLQRMSANAHESLTRAVLAAQNTQLIGGLSFEQRPAPPLEIKVSLLFQKDRGISS